ncbi:MAG: type IV pili methyl-accepting chemotaxis transducer N-terminal domain-containing protein, partial [Betaproteobacteria bacterium]
VSHPRHWSLGAKLTLVSAPFIVLGLLAIAATLWVSWQLDGGAAAINEVGRIRMQSYRIALAKSSGDAKIVAERAAEFERSLDLLRKGDPERPLFVPWDDVTHQQFTLVERDWTAFQRRWMSAEPNPSIGLADETAGMVADIDTLVGGIEHHMARWTTLLHLLQIGILFFAILGATLLLYMGYRFVLEPVARLKDATERIQGGDFGARVERVTSDEFGALAKCFNDMAEHLQSMHRDLEAKVADKTSQLEEKSARLEALYDVTMLVAKAVTLKELSSGFAERMKRVAHADGIILRWSDESNERFLLLASSGVPAAMAEGEQCLHAGTCHCGVLKQMSAVRVIPIAQMKMAGIHYCANAGFSTLISVPVRLHDRLLGEVDLFFHAQITLSPAEQSLMEALTAHLASAMENLRLKALEQEAAVAQERTFIARELHDSIAQSLAFLKIQVQLMRDAIAGGNEQLVAQVLGEIDAGVRESYGDVRELLVHFRTRAQDEDIGPALQTTLRKFEHQSGVSASLRLEGHGIPLVSDQQIQVLHIVQEALSNVRKHAHAAHVWLDVQQQPQWRFEVRDDGIGFRSEGASFDETHVGLRIMAERAEKIGATLDIVSTPGRGTSVVLAFAPQPVAPSIVLTEAVRAIRH